MGQFVLARDSQESEQSVLEHRGAGSSLRRRLVLLVLVAVVPLAVLTVVQTVAMRAQALSQARDMVRDVAREAALDLQRRVQGALQLLNAMAQNPVLRGTDLAACSAVLVEQLKLGRRYASFYVADRSGALLCHSAPQVGPVSHADREYFRRALASKRPEVGEPVVGHVAGRPVLPIAWPILDGRNEIERVLGLGIDLAWFGQLQTVSRRLEDMTLVLWDREGRVLYRQPDNEKWGGRTDASAPIVQMVRSQGDSKSAEVVGLDGVERIQAFERLREIGPGVMTLSVGVAKERVVAAVDRRLALELAVIALALAAGCAAALAVAEGFVRRPVRGLVSAAGRLAEGDLSTRVPEKGLRGELAELGAAFNRMASRLQQTLASRADLEREIVERRRVEAELADLYDNAPCGYHAVDAEGRIVRMNDTWLKWLGYAREEVVGRKFHPDLMTPESAEQFRTRSFPLFKRQGWLKDAEFEYVRKDGSTFPASLNATTIHDPEGRYLMSRSVVFDMTERKRIERELEMLNRRLEAANKELESFSYSVSHDLRAPLRAVDGYALMLEEEYAGRLDEEGRRLLAVVREEAARMGQLIDDLLAFSRTGRKAMESAPVDMKALAAEAVAELSREHPAAAVEISDLPRATGDRALLKQVWANLVGNALKYSSKNPAPRVQIGGARNGAEVEFWVRDNGAGFDPRYAGKLFGVFQRLHRADEFPGTGVGLAIVGRVVARHGGRVWAEGKPKEGARFCFALPATGSES
jgi:PAS domain S-box-containing protein